MAQKHIFSAVVSLFLLSTSCYFSRPVHARQSNFFSKTAEYAPAPAPGPATAPVPTLVETGYGLYGSESEYSNTVMTPQTDNKFVNEVTLSESSNNDEVMLSEDESLDKEQSNDDFNNNENGYFDNYKTNSNNEGQGMSDTRYMESGKYYYDIKTDDALTNYQNNNNGYSSTTTSDEDDDETIDPQVYGSSNEFNTMEEYYRSHSYQNTKEQEEYVP